MARKASLLLVVMALACLCGFAQATTYEVGPGKTYTNVGDVPWESITAGDSILIYWRDTPYKEKFCIAAQGTAQSPVLIQGVPGVGGELPILDGNDATTRLALSYWNDERCIIKIGGGTIPTDVVASYITIENLEIKSARNAYTYTCDEGTVKSYTAGAASIYVCWGENITIRNCIFNDCGNGFFVASSDDPASVDVLVEGCYIYDNGNDASIYEHNSYCAAVGMVYQYNHYGPLREGCSGNNLKDRSSGMIARYNWIESGNRQLDLVEGADSVLISGDSAYSTTFLYGNILVEDESGNKQICHYGGDGGNSTIYRKGTCYLYNNTIVSSRALGTTLMRLSSNDETCDARNNIVYMTAAGNTLRLLDSDGTLNISHNWMKSGWIEGGTVNDDSTTVIGTSPGFLNEGQQDYRLASGSDCIDAGTTLASACLPDHNVTMQYVVHQGSESRPSDPTFDIGAYEFESGIIYDLTITTSTLDAGLVDSAYSETLTASGGVTPFAWSVISGSLPSGLALTSATGVISGTPTTAGTSNFTVQVTDDQDPADSDTQALSIVIIEAVDITTTSLPDVKKRTSYSQTLQVSGGTSPYTWSIISGSLPSGLSLASSTGVISGTAPSKTGTSTFTVKVIDSQTPSASDTQALSITVTR